MSCELLQQSGVLIPQAVMGRAWGAIALLVGATTQYCIAFVPASFGVKSHAAPESAATAAAWTSGGISIGSHLVRRPARRSDSCASLMMAKKPKMGKGKGKGKASRMELIESVAALERGGAPVSKGEGGQAEGSEEEEGASSSFNVDKLKAETKTPFRTLRVFIYGGFGVSALIGAVTSLTQLAATLSEQPGALELQKVLINLLVDSGVMAAAAFCYNFETSQQEGLEKVEADNRERRRRLAATKITDDVNAERVNQLRALRVKVPGSGTGEDLEGAKEAPVGVLMDEAKQGFCVLAGGRDFIRDSMLAAMLAKNQIFPSLNLLVVPVDMGGADEARGFGKALSYEEEGYVAAPADEDEWRAVMREEFEAAERQGAAKTSSVADGIVLVVSKKGKVLRRGVGIPIWKTIRDDVDPPLKKKDDK